MNISHEIVKDQEDISREPQQITMLPANIEQARGGHVIEYNDDMMGLLEQIAIYLGKSGNIKLMESVGFLALMLNPKDPRADLWVGLGLEEHGNVEDAKLAFETAIEKAPRLGQAHLALGILLLKEGDYKEAMRYLQVALALEPGQSRALQALMLCLLAVGELERGWAIYARRYRFKSVDRMMNKYPDQIPWWDGISKRNVLMIAEEGYGERIMFSSMIADAVANGATPVIEMLGEFNKFVPLFKRSFPGALIGTENTNQPVNAKVNIGDLGGFYRRSFADFPKHNGYLKADKARTEAFRRRLSPGPVIGVSWKSEGPVGGFKSIPLELFNPLFRNFRCTFVDLQYGDTVDERGEWAPMLNHLPDVDLRDDIDGVAALIASCDLVITISNVTAHLAGALGVPVWMLAPKPRGLMWFWFDGREDSPWYPSMKVYRQHPEGWAPMIEQVAHDLSAREWPAWKDDNTL